MEEKKSNKGLLIAIIIVLIILVIGVFGLVGYTIFYGGSSDDKSNSRDSRTSHHNKDDDDEDDDEDDDDDDDDDKDDDKDDADEDFISLREEKIEECGLGYSVGNVLPEFEFENEDGDMISSLEFLGKPTYFNCFATWCYYCCEEMPDINAANSEYKDEMNFIILDVQEGFDTVNSYMSDEGFSLDTYLLDDWYIGDYEVMGIPVSIVVDRYGVIVAVKEEMAEADWIEDSVAEAIAVK